MKHIFFILLLSAFCLQLRAQNAHILLEYDNAGNRIVRRQEGTDIEVHKSLLTTSNAVGDNVSFLIQITNTGVQNALNLHFHDVWKKGCFEYQSFSLAEGHPFPYNVSISNVTAESADVLVAELNAGQSLWLVMNFTHLNRCATCPNTIHFEEYEGTELNDANNEASASIAPQGEVGQLFIDAPNMIIQPSTALGFTGGGGLVLQMQALLRCK